MNDIYEELINKLDNAKFKYSELYFYSILLK